MSEASVTNKENKTINDNQLESPMTNKEVGKSIQEDNESIAGNTNEKDNEIVSGHHILNGLNLLSSNTDNGLIFNEDLLSSSKSLPQDNISEIQNTEKPENSVLSNDDINNIKNELEYQLDENNKINRNKHSVKEIKEIEKKIDENLESNNNQQVVINSSKDNNDEVVNAKLTNNTDKISESKFEKKNTLGQLKLAKAGNKQETENQFKITKEIITKLKEEKAIYSKNKKEEDENYIESNNDIINNEKPSEQKLSKKNTLNLTKTPKIKISNAKININAVDKGEKTGMNDNNTNINTNQNIIELTPSNKNKKQFLKTLTLKTKTDSKIPTIPENRTNKEDQISKDLEELITKLKLDDNDDKKSPVELIKNLKPRKSTKTADINDDLINILKDASNPSATQASKAMLKIKKNFQMNNEDYNEFLKKLKENKLNGLKTYLKSTLASKLKVVRNNGGEKQKENNKNELKKLNSLSPDNRKYNKYQKNTNDINELEAKAKDNYEKFLKINKNFFKKSKITNRNYSEEIPFDEILSKFSVEENKNNAEKKLITAKTSNNVFKNKDKIKRNVKSERKKSIEHLKK